jgi:3-methyladenine DNA glycosylase AlkD
LKFKILIERNLMHPYIFPMTSLFQSNADPSAAEPMAAYMRNKFPFLGIKSPLRRELEREFIDEHGLPPLEELSLVLLDLWSLPEREYQYTALMLLGKFERKLPPDFIETIETLLTTKSWWDTVDTIASNTVGTHFRLFPEVRKLKLAQWRSSENFWLRRTCILFQLKYKKETDFELLKAIIRENLGSKEFFINKAIGWSLRQYSRVDPESVRNFVAETPLAPLSAKEALKWLKRQEEKSL